MNIFDVYCSSHRWLVLANRKVGHFVIVFNSELFLITAARLLFRLILTGLGNEGLLSKGAATATAMLVSSNRVRSPLVELVVILQ